MRESSSLLSHPFEENERSGTHPDISLISHEKHGHHNHFELLELEAGGGLELEAGGGLELEAGGGLELEGEGELEAGGITIELELCAELGLDGELGLLLLGLEEEE
jgi:hypothetical protein